MNTRRSVAFVLSAVLILIAVRAGFARPTPAPDNPYPYAADDARILAEIQNNSEAMANLEYLSDSIGARLSGGPGLKRANEWTKQKFTEYGLTNVHLEPWTVERTWTRGTASARITAPAEHPLVIAAAAWSPGTPGAVHGPVVYFDAKEKKDYEKFRGKLKGAIVIYQEPASSVAAAAGRQYARVYAADAEAAGAHRRIAGRRSVRRNFADGKGARRVLESGRRRRSVARFRQTARLAEHDRRQLVALCGGNDSGGVHHRRRLPDDLASDETRAGDCRNRDDEFVRQSRSRFTTRSPICAVRKSRTKW